MTRRAAPAASLFAAARRNPARDEEPPVLLDTRARGIAYVTASPGCHDCPHWHRANAATGRCAEVAARHGSADSHPWLTSYAYCCPAHPARIERSDHGEQAVRRQASAAR